MGRTRTCSCPWILVRGHTSGPLALALINSWYSETPLQPRCLQGQSFGVHAGFWSKLQECKRSIASELKKLVERKLSKTPWRVVITGHSQGGGLAQLFFLYLQMLRGDPQDFHDVPDKLKEELGESSEKLQTSRKQGCHSDQLTHGTLQVTTRPTSRSFGSRVPHQRLKRSGALALPGPAS